MSFKDYLNKIIEGQEFVSGDIVGLSNLYNLSRPFLQSKNLLNFFGEDIITIFRDIEARNKVKIKIKDRAKGHFLIFIDGSLGFNSTVPTLIDTPEKYVGNVTIDNVLCVFKRKFPELKILVRDKRYYDIYVKYEKRVKR
jgi:hypothetical protein